MMANASKDELIRFLDYTADRGLLKKATASSLKAACNTVLSVLDSDEEADIFAVDMDNLVQRFANKKGMDVKPGTLRSYRQRVLQALNEFQRYKEDPVNWKPAGTQRSPRATDVRKPESSTSDKQANQVANGPKNEFGQQMTVEGLVHRFPLRRDAIVEISGLPFDVTKSEMTRMGNFLHTLVADPESDVQPRLMLNPHGEENT